MWEIWTSVSGVLFCVSLDVQHLLTSVKLFVQQILYVATDKSRLREVFSAFGLVTKVTLRRGFGFITLGSREAAEDAISKMDRSQLDGRVIRVKEKKPNESGATNKSGTKPKMKIQKKKAAPLVSGVESNGSSGAESSPKDKADKDKKKSDKGKVKKSQQKPKMGDIFECPSCKEQYQTYNKCEEHTKKCLFGLVSHLKPVVKRGK